MFKIKLASLSDSSVICPFNGKGIFGEPTNNEVYIMGISHVEFGPRGIRREFCLYDEVAIWKQILAD